MSRDRRRESDPLRRIVQRWAEPADQWRTKVQRWVDAGIVSPAQGVEIVALESSEPTATSRADANELRLSPLIELITYFGIVVVGLSAALFLGHYWSSIAGAGHMSVALTVTVAGLAGGFVISQSSDAGARRLGGFLRLLGTAGAAAATAIAFGSKSDHHHGITLFYVGVVVMGVSAAIWRNRDRSLQF